MGIPLGLCKVAGRFRCPEFNLDDYVGQHSVGRTDTFIPSLAALLQHSREYASSLTVTEKKESKKSYSSGRSYNSKQKTVDNYVDDTVPTIIYLDNHFND